LRTDAASFAEHAGRFGFRTDQGRSTPRHGAGTAFLAVPLAVLTLIWLLLARLQSMISPKRVPGVGIKHYVYLLFYAFAILLIAICHYILA